MNENQKSKKEVKASNKKKVSQKSKEVGGSEGPEPTRYGAVSYTHLTLPTIYSV